MLVVWFSVDSIAKDDHVLVPFEMQINKNKMVKSEDKEEEGHASALSKIDCTGN